MSTKKTENKTVKKETAKKETVKKETVKKPQKAASEKTAKAKSEKTVKAEKEIKVKVEKSPKAKTEKKKPEKEKKKISINSIIPTTIILTLICTVVTAANAVTNMYTKDRIATIEQETLNSSMKEVIEADNYSDPVSVKTKEGNTVTYYTAEKSGSPAGYIFVCENDGYGGKVRCMTGIDLTGTITAVRILSVADETPGLGQNAAKESFYSQYTGKTSGVNMVKNAVAEGENAVKSLTGATFTSNAVHKDIADSFEIYETVKEETEENETTEETQENAEEGENTDE